MYELGWLASWLDGREEYSFDGWMDGGKDRWFCPQAALLSATSAEAEAIVVQWLKDGRDDPLRPAHYTWIFMNACTSVYCIAHSRVICRGRNI